MFALMLHIPGLLTPNGVRTAAQTWSDEWKRWWYTSQHLYNPFINHDHRIFQFYNVAIWSIPVEFAGSMLVYSLIALYLWVVVRMGKTAQATHGATVVFFATATLLYLQTASWVNACFIGGMFLAYLDLHGLDTAILEANLTERARKGLYIACIVIGLYFLGEPTFDGHPEKSARTPGWALLTYIIPDHYYDAKADEYYRYWHTWGGFFLVYGVMHLRGAQRFLETRIARFLGRTSFMLYIFHEPVMLALHDRWVRMIGAATFDGPPMDNWDLSWWENRLWVPDVGPLMLSTRMLVQSGGMLAVVLVVAHFAVRFLDEPCVRLSKAITRKLGIDKD